MGGFWSDSQGLRGVLRGGLRGPKVDPGVTPPVLIPESVSSATTAFGPSLKVPSTGGLTFAVEGPNPAEDVAEVAWT